MKNPRSKMISGSQIPQLGIPHASSEDYYSADITLNWSKTWGGIQYDAGNGIVIDRNNNLYVIGETVSFGLGNSDIMLLRYNNFHIEEW